MKNEPVFVPHQKPRDRAVFPQSTSQELGWLIVNGGAARAAGVRDRPLPGVAWPIQVSHR